MTLLTPENRKSFKENKFLVIDDFLPSQMAEHLEEMCKNTNTFETIHQTRTKHYSHIFKSENPQLPDPKEHYMASFNKSDMMGSHEVVENIFDKYIKPMCDYLTEDKIKYYTVPLCYKMTSGDFMRVHKDLYGGIIGYNFYFSKDWKWDWGGIVNYFLKEDDVVQTFPKFNRIVFRDEASNLPHFVTPITEYALNDRFTLNGWGAQSDFSSDRVFGKYKSYEK